MNEKGEDPDHTSAAQNENNAKLVEIEASIEIHKRSAYYFNNRSSLFVRAGRIFGIYATAASVAVFSMPTTVFALGDAFLTGGAITAATGFLFGVSYLAKRMEKKVRKDLTGLEEKKEQFLKSLPAPDTLKAPPPVPAMLKLADAFNPGLAPEGTTPARQSRPKPSGMK